SVVNVLFEAFDRSAEIGADRLETLRTEDHQSDHEDDQQFSETKITHSILPLEPRNHTPKRAGPRLRPCHSGLPTRCRYSRSESPSVARAGGTCSQNVTGPSFVRLTCM